MASPLQAIEDCLAATSRTDSPPLCLLPTPRADFLRHASTHPGLTALLDRSNGPCHSGRVFMATEASLPKCLSKPRYLLRLNPMRHPINPKIDCVFKALLGAQSNQALLIHFLNAILGSTLSEPITDTTILNPYNEREFLDDKLSIVDVKARDEALRQYQIEIQLLDHADLRARILYGWTDLYSAQLQSGKDFGTLRPTYAIWLLEEKLLPDKEYPDYAHNFQLRDRRGNRFLDHGGIWLLELSKFNQRTVETEQQRWLKFFNEAEHLDESALPIWMQTREMRQAMTTLKTFSEKERAYHAYQARENYLRMQRGNQRHLEELRTELGQARVAEERERAAKEQARAAEEQARAAEEQARVSEEQERAAKKEALAEVERLERLLKDRQDGLSDE